MNFTDRVKVTRRDEGPVVGGNPTIITTVLYEALPCRFEFLTAEQNRDEWAGAYITSYYTTNKANIHVPHTIPEWPTTDGGQLDISRYRVELISPQMEALDGKKVWKVSNKRPYRRHTTYELSLGT